MEIQLSDHFDYVRLLRFTIPSIVMMVFTSVYTVVDGFFISNFVGITEFAAINLIFPFIQILGAVGFMLGAGGSALVSKTLGENDAHKANRIFSLLVYVGIAAGVLLAAVGIISVKPISILMRADTQMLPYCVTYGSILLCAIPLFMMQNMFQSFLITAERPTLGLIITIAAGVTNIVLDALFIIVFDWGIVGAACATAIAQGVGGIIPLIFFIQNNKTPLRLCKCNFDGSSLFRSCTNGSSELVSNISMSVVSILYNFQLMKFAGQNGVAAYGAIMYVSFIFVAIFIGYSIGVAPVISFHYGAENTGELKNLFKKSNIIIGISSFALALIAFVFARPTAEIFLGADTALTNPELIEMTVDCFRYYSVSVLFVGFCIFGSSFFTALNNGIVSALISFLRTLVFQISMVIILPFIFDVDGIWYSFFCSEILAAAVTFIFLGAMKKKYKY